VKTTLGKAITMNISNYSEIDKNGRGKNIMENTEKYNVQIFNIIEEIEDIIDESQEQGEKLRMESNSG
jgi:hypothetical protein